MYQSPSARLDRNTDPSALTSHQTQYASRHCGDEPHRQGKATATAKCYLGGNWDPSDLRTSGFNHGGCTTAVMQVREYDARMMYVHYPA